LVVQVGAIGPESDAGAARTPAAPRCPDSTPQRARRQRPLAMTTAAPDYTSRVRRRQRARRRHRGSNRAPNRGIGEASAGPRSPQSRDPTHRSRRGCARYLRRGLWRRAAHAAGAQRPQGASAPHGETQSSIRRRAFRDDPEKPCRALALATSDAHVSAASAPGLHELPGRDGGRSSVHQSSTGPRNCAAAPLTRRRGYREARLFAGTSLTPEDAPRTPDLLRIRQYLDRQPGNEKSVDLRAFSSG
jgi:hypothetical protein